MNKLMSALLALSLVLGTVSISFAQDVPTDTAKKNKKKKKNQKTTSSPVKKL